MLSEYIKTEVEIIESYVKWKEFYERNEMPKDIEEAVYKKAETKWVSLSWLKEQIEKERKNYPTTTSSEWIENGSVKDFVGWLLYLLEQEGK